MIRSDFLRTMLAPVLAPVAVMCAVRPFGVEDLVVRLELDDSEFRSGMERVRADMRRRDYGAARRKLDALASEPGFHIVPVGPVYRWRSS